jgi:hypothetical protein
VNAIMAEEGLPLVFLDFLQLGSEPRFQLFACWVFSSIFVVHQHIDTVLQLGAFPVMIDLLNTGPFKIESMVTKAIFHAVFYGTKHHSYYLAEIGCIEALCNVLHERDSDNSLTFLYALRSLGKMLDCGARHVDDCTRAGDRSAKNRIAKKITDVGGTTKLREFVQNNTNVDVVKEAQKILKVLLPRRGGCR